MGKSMVSGFDFPDLTNPLIGGLYTTLQVSKLAAAFNPLGKYWIVDHICCIIGSLSPLTNLNLSKRRPALPSSLPLLSLCYTLFSSFSLQFLTNPSSNHLFFTYEIPSDIPNNRGIS